MINETQDLQIQRLFRQSAEEIEVPANLSERSAPANGAASGRRRLWAIGGAAAAVLVGVVAIATIRPDDQPQSSADEPSVISSSVLDAGAASWDTGIPTFDIDLDTSGSVVTFERGANDGIAVGMPVVDGSGLIGKVTSVTNESSTVLLITQPEFSIAAQVDDSIEVYEVSGTSDGRVVVRGETAFDESAIGRVLVTTGGLSIAPPGIPVGIIDSITNDERDDGVLATVRTFDTFGDFTNVNVMLYRPTADQNIGAGSFPLDGLDPYSAAAMISLDVRLGPTPDEQADLEAAGAILERECLRDGGATPPTVTAAEHEAFRYDVIESLIAKADFVTTTGIEFQRTNGYFSRYSFDTASDAPLHLVIQEGSLEERLLIDGCGAADNALRAGPAERALRESTIESRDSRWYPLSLSPQALPEFADEYQPYDNCLSAAGYPNHDDPNADNSPFAEFLLDPEVSADELAFANADADCRISTDLPTTYVEMLVPVLDEFQREHAIEIAAVEVEREDALESARSILIENEIEPFTT